MLIDTIISVLGYSISSITVILFIMTVIYWSRKTKKSEKSPFVSVVIATMNEEEKIEDNIKNLLNQTYKKYEVIYIDESKDNTRGIIERYVKKSSKIKLIKLGGDRHGKRTCLEIGIKKSKGEIILYTDADCRPKKDWIQNMVNELAKSDAVISSSIIKAKTLFDEVKKVEHIYYTGIIPTAAIIARSSVRVGWGGNMGFWRKAFEKIDGYRGIENYIAEDDALINKIYKNKMNVKFSFNSMLSMEMLSEKKWLKQKFRWIRITRQLLGRAKTIFYFYPMLFSHVIAVILSVIGLLAKSGIWFTPMLTLYSAEAFCIMYTYISIKEYKKVLFSPVMSLFDFIIKFLYLYSLFKKEVYWKGKIKINK